MCSREWRLIKPPPLSPTTLYLSPRSRCKCSAIVSPSQSVNDLWERSFFRGIWQQSENALHFLLVCSAALLPAAHTQQETPRPLGGWKRVTPHYNDFFWLCILQGGCCSSRWDLTPGSSKNWVSNSFISRFTIVSGCIVRGGPLTGYPIITRNKDASFKGFKVICTSATVSKWQLKCYDLSSSNDAT